MGSWYILHSWLHLSLSLHQRSWLSSEPFWSNMELKGAKSRSAKKCPVPEDMRHDLMTICSIARHTAMVPLPILHPPGCAALDAVKTYTDISGHLMDSPSMGVYISSQSTEAPIVASLAFPRSFLCLTDKENKKVYCKTTALEALGYLVALCLDPLRYAEKDALFPVDNMAAVLALQRGYSRDPWTSTIVRAARVMAAGIGCSIYSEWERRRSSRPTRIADDLTHNLLSELSTVELDAYINLGQVSFPQPVLDWMATPGPDPGLGYRCLLWLRHQFPGLRILRPTYI